MYCGIPTVIGAINGTQILIQKPSCEDWYQYFNRKSKMAINVGVSSHLYCWGKFQIEKSEIYSNCNETFGMQVQIKHLTGSLVQL